jgi:tetratricopeptide (TPR) repeat protein
MKARVASLLLVLCAPVWVRAQDEVTYHDKATNRDVKLTGTIQSESPAALVVKPATGAAVTIPVKDVLDVVYNVPILLRPEYRAAIKRESDAEKLTKEDVRKREITEVLARLEKLLKDTTDERLKRHLEFKIGRLLAAQAESDPALAGAALTRLSQFCRDHKSSWQSSRAADALVALYLQKGDWEGAKRTNDDLANTPGLDDSTRADYGMKSARILIKAKQLPAAQTILAEVAKRVPPDSPAGLRSQVLSAECQAASGDVAQAAQAAERLESLIDRLSDPEIKAAAYNALGDCHRLADRSRDALWVYLWVDVVYYQNRHEHARALYHLIQIFKDRKDDKRVQQFYEKLAGPPFAGTEHQRLLLAQKHP